MHFPAALTQLVKGLRYVAAAALLLCFDFVQSAPAHERPAGSDEKQTSAAPEIDSEHIFGITEGSDVGDAGEKEVEVEPFGRFGKRTGAYAATSTSVLAKYTPIDNFRLAAGFSLASHNISNVPDLPNANQFRWGSVDAEFRYRLLDRERAPFGLTLSAAPSFGRVDETTGLPVDQFSVEWEALFDKDLVPDRLFAALNLLYEPAWTRGPPLGESGREAVVGASTALSVQIVPGLFTAAEIRYLRKYEGVSLNTFLGEALFFGPSLYAVFPNRWFASIAWNAQVAGHAVGDPLGLDLVNFERHLVRVRFGVNF
jgi:hypothetical protein